MLGRGDAGTADIHNSEPEPALVEIVRACDEALAAAGASSSDLAAAAFSLAGADWPEDFVLLREELTRRLGLEREPVIVNDGIGAAPLRHRGRGRRRGGDRHVLRRRRAERRRRDLPPRLLARFDGRVRARLRGARGDLAEHARTRTAHLDARLARSSSGTARARRTCSTSSRASTTACRRWPSGRASPPRCSTRRKRATSSPATSCAASAAGPATTPASRPSAPGQLGQPFPLVLLGGVLRHPSPLAPRRDPRPRCPSRRPSTPTSSPSSARFCSPPTASARRPDRDGIRDALDWTEEPA